MNAHPSRIRRTWQRISSEPQLKRNVLALVALVTAGLVAGGYILTMQQVRVPWDGKNRYSVTFESAPAINPASRQEVRIAGIAVGDIREASVDDRGHARLELAIDKGHQIYDNARVLLRPKSPLNEMYVELNPGGPPGKRLPEGGVLPVANSVRPVQVDEALGHLDANTRDALTTLLAESDVALAGAPANLPEGLDATDQVVRDLQPVVTALQTRKETLQKLVTALGQIASATGGDDERLGALAESLQKTLATVGQRNGDLDAALAQLPDFTDQLQQATGSVGALSAQLDPVLDKLREASGTLPSSLEKFTGTVDKLGQTVDSARPVVDKAIPVVRDLRPFVGDLNASLGDLHAVTGQLGPITTAVLPYLNDLAAFVTNSRSITSLRDGTGGAYRAMAQLSPESITGLLPLLPALQAAVPR
ncbi:MlaD family protein [Amycolatopsis palatopharyngis]|uniref:MlaD family protein n=1 Tax=Amycolatopsis palatopharyngis TaxID=187982 RepID=UPI000E27E70D|nr:MlaD family protein [Amycolatopsis palatopharyngis]